MSDTGLQFSVIAAKEVSDAVRIKILTIITLILTGAGIIALVVGAIALSAEVANYNTARDLLISLGKPVDALAPPSFIPLKLMRGFIEYVEIIGAVLGIVLGHRAASAERGRNTLGLLLSRPLPQWVLIGGKSLGNLLALAGVLALVFALGTVGIALIGKVTLTGMDYARIAVTFGAAIVYVGMFFLMGFLLALHMKRSSHALLAAFTIWLALVLIAPQIGDTLDPDNQVGSGVFRTMGIPESEAQDIMKSFATYETVRDGIEQLSPAKHFERWSFAALGIKEIYAGKTLSYVFNDRYNDLLWLTGPFLALLAALFLIPLNISKLNQN